MKRFLSILLLVWFCNATFAAVPAAEGLLASDTLAVITIPDYTRAQAVWAQWPSSRLWSDPALKPFRDKFTAKFSSEYIVPLEKELGVKLEDYSGLAQGQITFAVTQGEWDGKSDKTPGFLLLVDS